MFNPPGQPLSIPPLRLLAMVALGNAVIALVITELVPASGPYLHNLVYSQCIGLSICLLMIGLSMLVGPRYASVTAAVVIGVVSTIGGFLIGGTLGATIQGHPVSFLANWLRQNMLIQILAIGGGTSLAYNIVFWFRRHVAELRLEAASERAKAEAALRQASEAQLGMIRAQIEPHMLFNTLANLRVLIGLNPPAAQQMLDRLIAFMRVTLSSSRRSRVCLKDEFSMLDDYLELIAIRMGDRMTFQLDLPADLAEQPVLPLLLQPFVENAVRHGIEPAVDGGHIRVDARRNGSNLVLRVINTGSPYRPSELADADLNGGGFGLAQIHERLATAYGESASLRIDSLPATITEEPALAEFADADGTLVTLTFPWSVAEPRQTASSEVARAVRS